MLCHWRNQNELEKTSEPEAKRLRGQSNVWPTFVAKMSSTRRNPNYLRSVFPISFMRMGAGLGRWGVSCLWCLDRLNIYTCNVLSLTHHGKRCTRRINWHVLLMKVPLCLRLKLMWWYKTLTNTRPKLWGRGLCPCNLAALEIWKSLVGNVREWSVQNVRAILCCLINLFRFHAILNHVPASRVN